MNNWKLINLFDSHNTYEVNNFPFSIGRNRAAQVCIKSVLFSREHATIIKENGKLFIADNSTNGTYINSVKLLKKQRREIVDKDEIGFAGSTQLIKDTNLQPPYYIFKLIRDKQQEQDESNNITNTNTVCDNNEKSNSTTNDNNDEIVANNETFKLDDNKKTEKNEKNNGDQANSNVIIEEKSREEQILPTIKQEKISEEPNMVENSENCDDDEDVIILSQEDLSTVIVIDDSDDDEARDVIYSQLFIKKEPVIDEVFLEIKKELEELHSYENDHLNPPIPVATDSENDDSEDEFLNALKACPLPNANANNNANSASKASTDEKDLKQIAEQINAKHAHAKPEVIAALPLAQRTRNKHRCNDNESTNLPSTSGTRNGQHPFIREEPPPKRARVAHKPKVKVSENRGMFLTVSDMPPPPPIKPQRVSNQNHPQANHVSIDVKMKLIPIALPSQPAILKIHPNVKSSKFNNVNGNGVNRLMLDPRKMPPAVAEHEPFLLNVLNWNVEAFETRNIDVIALWPQFAGKPMHQIPTRFDRFAYYKEEMQMQVMGDLFSEIYNYHQSIGYQNQRGNKGKDTFAGTVEHVIKRPNYTEMICYTYIETKDVRTGSHIKDSHLISFTARVGGGKLLKTMFGIVTWFETQMVRGTDEIDATIAKECKSFPLYKLRFAIMVKKNASVIENVHIYARQFTSLHRFMKRLSAIAKVEETLHMYILRPRADLFQIHDRRKHSLLKDLPKLNPKQNDVVQTALNFCSPRCNSKVFMIEGPPGTGKSFVIVNIVMNLLQNLEENTAILLLAQSNNAIDHLVHLLKEIKNAADGAPYHKLIRLVRIGCRPSVSSEALSNHIDELVALNMRSAVFQQSPQHKLEYQKCASEIQKLRMKSDKSPEEEKLMRQRQMELDLFLKNYFLHGYKKEEMKTRDEVFLHSKIICSTIGSCLTFPQHKYANLKFKCCIIDESTQAQETDTILPLLLNVDKFILVGDTHQLPAVNNLIPKDFFFGRSLFARIKAALVLDANKAIHTLRQQYRMVGEICQFPNRMFYNGILETHHKAKPRPDLQSLVPYIVFEHNPDINKSNDYVDQQEIAHVFSIIKAINEIVVLAKPLIIGVITPYNDQKTQILNNLQQLGISDKIKVKCNTIDSFQGQEEEIIILTCVRHMSNRFVNDANRMNVALTRAKSALYVVASSPLFKSSSLMRLLKEDAVKRNFYRRMASNESAATIQKILIRDSFVY